MRVFSLKPILNTFLYRKLLQTSGVKVILWNANCSHSFCFLQIRLIESPITLFLSVFVYLLYHRICVEELSYSHTCYTRSYSH